MWVTGGDLRGLIGFAGGAFWWHEEKAYWSPVVFLGIAEAPVLDSCLFYQTLKLSYPKHPKKPMISTTSPLFSRWLVLYRCYTNRRG